MSLNYLNPQSAHPRANKNALSKINTQQYQKARNSLKFEQDRTALRAKIGRSKIGYESTQDIADQIIQNILAKNGNFEDIRRENIEGVVRNILSTIGLDKTSPQFVRAAAMISALTLIGIYGTSCATFATSSDNIASDRDGDALKGDNSAKHFKNAPARPETEPDTPLPNTELTDHDQETITEQDQLPKHAPPAFGHIIEFVPAPGAFEEYLEKLTPERQKFLETQLAAFKKPDLIKNFLLKYQLELGDESNIRFVLETLSRTSPALECILDTFQNFYGMEFNNTILNQAIELLHYQEIIMQAKIKSDWSKKVDFDLDEVRELFLNNAKKITRNLCRPEYRDFTDKFSSLTGRPTPVMPLLIDAIAKTYNMHSQPDWPELVAMHDNLKTSFPDLYANNSALLGLTALAYPELSSNWHNLAASGIRLDETKYLSRADLEFLTTENIPPKFLAYLQWVSTNFNQPPFNINQIGKLREDFSDNEIENIPLTRQLAETIKLEGAARDYSGNLMQFLKYCHHKEPIDKIAAAFNLSTKNECLIQLTDIYAAISHEYDIKGAKQVIDLFDPETRALFNMYFQPEAQKKAASENPGQFKFHPDPEKSQIYEFREAFKKLVSTMKNTPAEDQKILVALANQGFIWRNVDDYLFSEQLPALLQIMHKNPDEFQNILQALEKGKIGPNFTFQYLISLYNMDRPTRTAFAQKIADLKPAFAQLGLPFDDPEVAAEIETVLQYSEVWDKLHQSLLEPETLQPDQGMLENIGTFSQAFNHRITRPSELFQIIEIIKKLDHNRDNLKKIAALYQEFPDQRGLDGFLISLSIYLRDYSRGGETFTAQFTNPASAKDFRAVLEKYQVSGAARDLLAETIPDEKHDSPSTLVLLQKNETYRWAQKIIQTFELEIQTYDELTSLLYHYQKSDLRAWLVTKEAADFYQQAKTSGKTYGRFHLDNMYIDYQNRDLLAYANLLKDKFGIDLNNKEDDLSGGLGALFGSYDAPRISPLDYLKAVQAGGFLDALKDPATVDRFNVIQKQLPLNTKMDEKAFLAFLQINGKPELFKKITDDKFIKFLYGFRSKCPQIPLGLPLIDFILAAYEAGNFFEILKQINTNLDSDLSIEEYEDIEVIVLLSRTPKLLAEIQTEKFKNTWQNFKAKAKQKVFITDLISIYSIQNNGTRLDHLYGRDFEEFLTHVLQKEGATLAERLEMSKYYQDNELKTQIASPGFRQTLHQSGLGSERLNPEAIRLGLFFHQNPEMIKPFLEAYKKAKPFFFAFGLEEHREIAVLLNSLPSFLILTTDPKVPAYRQIMLETLPYQDSPADGFALQSLTRQYPDEVAFKKVCSIISQNLTDAKLPMQTGKIKQKYAINDLLPVLNGTTPFNYNRENLEKELTANFPQDVRRTDTNAFSYASYNDLSRFSLFELNKARNIRTALDVQPKNRTDIARHIRADVETALVTELGGIISQNGAFEYLSPKSALADGSYDPAQEFYNQAPAALAWTHQHATKYADASYASPSGSLFHVGGDISFTATHQIDGVLITSLREGEFALHFYNERKDVLFLGRWEYSRNETE